MCIRDSPLDEEERSRIEVEDDYTLILVDVPMIEERNDKDWYGTIPLGIIAVSYTHLDVYKRQGYHPQYSQIPSLRSYVL